MLPGIFVILSAAKNLYPRLRPSREKTTPRAADVNYSLRQNILPSKQRQDVDKMVLNPQMLQRFHVDRSNNQPVCALHHRRQ